MEKLFRYIIFMFIMTLLTCSKEIVHARNDKTLQVECGEYSSDVLDYIKNNWKSFFGERELEEYEGHDIVIGEPYGVFSVDEGKMIATKFPVYVNEKCVQILDVFEDDNGKLIWSATISEDFLKKIDDLRQREGRYRFEVKENSNGGAPVLSIVKLDENNLRHKQGTLYSDINKSVIKIKRKGNSYFVESVKDKHKIVNISNLDCEEEQKYKPIGMTYLVEGKVNYEFCKKIGIKEWVYTKLWVTPYLYDRLFDTYLFR